MSRDGEAVRPKINNRKDNIYMPKIDTLFDDYIFDQADNPIAQYKDALEARNLKTINYTTEDLDKVLDSSLFRLSVSEFASFVKHEPQFKHLNTEQRYNIMLYMSLFAQVTYPKSCLPDLDYYIGGKPGYRNVKIMETLSPNINQVQVPEFCDSNYSSASVRCKIQTYSDDRSEGLTFDDAKQVIKFYTNHYNVDGCKLYDDDDHVVAFIDLIDDKINAVDTSLDANPFDLTSNESYTIEIEYDVDAHKLPIVTHFELKDCAQKAYKFAQQIQHVKANTDLIFFECLLMGLIDLNKLNMKHPHTIRKNVKSICDGNNNFERNIHFKDLAHLCNDLLNDFLSIAGKTPVKI